MLIFKLFTFVILQLARFKSLIKTFSHSISKTYNLGSVMYRKHTS